MRRPQVGIKVCCAALYQKSNMMEVGREKMMKYFASD